MAGMLSYRGWLFDWDGCLFDSMPIWWEGVEHLLAQDRWSEQLTVFRGRPGQMIEAFDNLPADEAEAFWQELRPWVLQNLLAKGRLFAGALEILKFLHHQGVALALVTNSEQSVTRPLLAKFGIKQYFDTVVTYDQVSQPKPAAEPVLLAVNRLSLPVEQSVMVGDSVKDVLSAKSAGASSIGVNFSQAPQVKPDLQFESLLQLWHRLAELAD